MVSRPQKCDLILASYCPTFAEDVQCDATARCGGEPGDFREVLGSPCRTAKVGGSHPLESGCAWRVFAGEGAFGNKGASDSRGIGGPACAGGVREGAGGMRQGG